MLRLIAEESFKSIIVQYSSLSSHDASAALAAAAKQITIDDDQIQTDLQRVRDLSMGGRENQMYIILDLKRAVITSVMSEPGTNQYSYFEYYPAPGLGANMPVGSDQRRMTFTVILGGVHGHPDSDRPLMFTLPTMSVDYDAAVCADAAGPDLRNRCYVQHRIAWQSRKYSPRQPRRHHR